MGEGEEELYIQRAPVRAELICQPEPGISQVRREDHGDFCFCAPPAFGPEEGDRADNAGPLVRGSSHCARHTGPRAKSWPAAVGTHM